MIDVDENSDSLSKSSGSSISSLLSSKDLSQSSSDLRTNKEKAKKFFHLFPSSKHTRSQSRSVTSSPMHTTDPTFPDFKEKTTKIRRHQTFNNRILSQQSKNLTKSLQLASLPLPLAPNYPGDVWTEVGPDGSVCRITGYDVSLHVEMNGCEQDSDYFRDTFMNEGLSTSTSPGKGVKKHRKVSRSKTFMRLEAVGRLPDFNYPVQLQQEGRLVLRLVETPDITKLDSRNVIIQNSLNESDEKSYSSVAPAAYISLSLRLLSIKNLTLQLTTNIQLKSSKKLSTFYKIVCLQSSRPSGPFIVNENCSIIGNTFQVDLNCSRFRPDEAALKAGKLQELYVMPCLEYSRISLSAWPFIKSREYHVGIYGWTNVSCRNEYCIYICATGFCPLSITISNTKKRSLNLFLIKSYVLPFTKLQSCIVEVKPESGGKIVGDKYILTKEELKNIYKPIKLLFTFVCDIKSCLNTLTTPSFRITFENKLLTWRYQASIKTFLFLPKWKPDLLDEEKQQIALNEKTKRIWNILLSKTRLKLTNIKNMDKKELCPVELAVCLASLKRNDSSNPYMLKCKSNEYLPIISRSTIERYDGKRYIKSLAIAYYFNHAGLVETQSLRFIPYEKYSEWPEINVARDKIIEAIVQPISQFTCCNAIVDKLLMSDICWTTFAHVVNFGEVFAVKAISENLNKKEKKYNLYFYIKQFQTFCDNPKTSRHFHKEILRSLLYMEEFVLAEDLMMDITFSSIAKHYTNYKSKIQTLIENLSSKTEMIEKKEVLYEKNKISQMSLQEYLDYWSQNIKNTHREKILILDRVITKLTQESHNIWPHFVASVIFVFSIDILQSSLTVL